MVMAGAASTASTIYEAVTGSPMPRIRDARATRMMVSINEPWERSVMIMENLMPMPTISTTPMMMPEQSRITPVVTMLVAPMARASMIIFGPIRVFLFSQLAMTMETMPPQAANVGV